MAVAIQQHRSKVVLIAALKVTRRFGNGVVLAGHIA